MKRNCFLLLLFVSMGIAAVGCGRKKDPGSSESVYQDDIYPTAYPATHSVTWVYFGFPGISVDNQRKINRILFEKETDCQIRFVSAGDINGLEYERALDDWENTESPDIITSSVWTVGDSEQYHFLETHMIPLNSYLDTVAGKKLRDCYTENEWKQVSLNGNIYVIPKAGYIAEDMGVDSGVYASVNDKYKDFFRGYDGTYASLKAIYEEIGDKNLHIVVSGFSDMLIYGLLGYSTMFHLPVQIDEKVIDITRSSDCMELIAELYSDLKSGVLVNKSVSAETNGEVLAYIHLCKGLPKEGFQEYLVAPCLYESSFGNRYGIAADSEKKELAFQVLSLCCSDPEILSLLYPGLSRDMLEKRVELLSSNPRSNLAGMHMALTDNQAEKLMKYSNEFTCLLSSMYFFNSDDELELNPEFEVYAAWNDFVARISSDMTVVKDIDEAMHKRTDNISSTE